MPCEYKLMPSPVGQLTLVARNGKLAAILWEAERANFLQVCPKEMLAHLPFPLTDEPAAMPAE